MTTLLKKPSIQYHNAANPFDGRAWERRNRDRIAAQADIAKKDAAPKKVQRWVAEKDGVSRQFLTQADLAQYLNVNSGRPRVAIDLNQKVKGWSIRFELVNEQKAGAR